MRHDKCYDGCGADKSCTSKCDARLVHELVTLPKDARNWPQPPRPGTENDSGSYLNAAVALFSPSSSRK